MASSPLRERDWCNVVTAHAGAPAAYTWRLANAAQGEHALRPPGAGGAAVTAVAVTACGNYALVGTAAGTLDRFNLQSGIHRGSFVRPPAAPPARRSGASAGAAPPGATGAQKGASMWAAAGPKKVVDVGAAAHDGAVTATDCDACNRFALSAALDGTLRIWAFRRRRPAAEVATGAPCERAAYHRGSCLFAAAGADRVVRCFDCASAPPRRVRTFSGHSDRLTDLQFSADGKWLLTACMDEALRVWDMPSGTLLQALRLGGPVASLALSPSGELLATVHPSKRRAPSPPPSPPPVRPRLLPPQRSQVGARLRVQAQ